MKGKYLEARCKGQPPETPQGGLFSMTWALREAKTMPTEAPV